MGLQGLEECKNSFGVIGELVVALLAGDCSWHGYCKASSFPFLPQ